MSYALLVTNVDGARVDGIWGPKPSWEELQYCIGGMWEEEQEKDIIHGLLQHGQHDVCDGSCTSYELSES